MAHFHGEFKMVPIILVLLFGVLSSCSSRKKPVIITSPDGKITMQINPSHSRSGENGKTLTYDVTYGGIPIVTESPLGMILNNNVIYSENIGIKGVDISGKNEIYSLPFGKHSEIRNNYNQAIILLKNNKKLSINLNVRVFNDGVAFRYHIPKQDFLSDVAIQRELTAFSFIGDHQYWGLHLNSYTTSYETDDTMSTLKNITSEELVGLPLLIKVADKAWVAITEADLNNYAGMYVSGVPGKSSTLRASLSPLPDSSGICVRAEAPIFSPWRVLMIGEKPGDLVESDIVLNLNNHYTGDFSWVKPGRVAWDWWSGQIVKGKGFEGAMDNRTMKYYIDFAGDYGLEYMLVDAGWYGDHSDGNVDITKSIPEINIPELVEYAGRSNVGIILWLNWKCVDRQMNEAFPLYQQWGVKGVKIDYMNRDDQEMVNFYGRAVQKAAEHKLLVDFHGAFKPTGIRRTLPNLITREGVMGLEYSKWSDRITPDHDCTIPFTRMLAGPMDYTPGGFSNASRSQFKAQFKEPMTQGTRCHQLALFVIFESPLQMLADHPANYRNKPGMDFIESVSTVWDDTRVLAAQVGDYVCIARRIDDEWFLGTITDWEPRQLTVSLDFLGDGDYMAVLYADGINPEDVKKSEYLVTKNDSITITMAAGGGYAARFYPAPQGKVLPRLPGK